MLTLTDLFAGAGGSSTGALQVPGINVRIAANHWQLVCDIHALNHPKTDHAVVDLHQERPSFFPRTDMLWASPECTKWSQATARIDRGLDYKCEDHGDYVLMLGGEEISYDRFGVEQFADEVWQESDGCGLYFCENHRERTKEHSAVQPKPDSLEWEARILADDSWAPWREQNATRVSVMRARALHTVEAAR